MVFSGSHINDSIQFCIQRTACTLCVMLLSIALLAAVINAATNGLELTWFLDYPMYSSVLRKLFPEGSMTETPVDRK